MKRSLVTLLQGVQTKNAKKKKKNKYKGKKYFKNYKDYKDKDKKSCYIAKDSNSSDDDEMVYNFVKHESNNEDDKRTLISHVSKNYTWIIDNGCSHHMIGDKSKFEQLEHYDGGSVRFGKNEPNCIKGKGCIIQTKEFRCDNTYWVEGLKHNLLSVAQLNNIAYLPSYLNSRHRYIRFVSKVFV